MVVMVIAVLVILCNIFNIIFLYQYIMKQIMMHKISLSVSCLIYDGKVTNGLFKKHYFYHNSICLLGNRLKSVKIMDGLTVTTLMEK